MWDKILEGVLSGASLITQAGLGGAGIVETQKQNKWQREFAQANFDWQKQRYAKEFDWRNQQLNIQRGREDTAVQRRMGDLHRAGINPLLAGSMAAGTANVPGSISSPVTSAPKFNDVGSQYSNLGLNSIQAAQGIMNILRQKADISMTYAETDRLKSLSSLNEQKKSHLDLSNPLELKQQMSTLSISEQKQVHMQLDKQFKALKIDAQQLDNARKIIQNKTANLGLTKLEQEIILKQMTVDYHKQFNTAPDIPGGVTGEIFKGANFAGNKVKEFWDFFKSKTFGKK